MLFQVCFVVQLYFLFYYYNGFKFSNFISNNPAVKTLPISVVICARNEAQNLQENLPAILAQNYSDFEVVVVNDCSNDDSSHILNQFKAAYPNLKIVTVSEHKLFKTGKKFALTMGIKAAKNEYLLFTDADCKPASEQWLQLMQDGFTDQKEIVLGYSPYRKTGGLFNTFIRFETIKTAINYLSAALNNNPYMGVGRNMGYTKSLFFRSKGFAAHMHLLSGDDDLFVNQNATAFNTTVQISPETHTYSEAKDSLGSYYRQKRRHMGVGKYYRTKNRILITLDALSGFLFYTFLTVLLLLKFEPWIVGGIFIFRLVIQSIIYPKIFRKLDAADLIWWLPLLDLFYYIYLNVFGIVGSVTKNLKWK
ncbi:glycosyltransferase [Mucilaginibacter sp. HMF7410]|uniref:Glycosyltransferase n=1 Tax=Mucilaginibacter arboris TaxID=2682090 RepID=A0A7K1SYA1_9SPHI|nr:glycosyltransferase [Mucilaginibacter arboris]